MDPSGVLLALEEQRKWRERRERIRSRMKQLERRRVYLQRELTRTRKKMSEYNTVLSDLKGTPHRDRAMIPPAVR